LDIYIEKLVKKKKEIREYLIIIGLSLLIPISGVVLYFVSFFRSIILPVILIIAYGIWIAVSGFNIEYEYILTNDELDIDKIVNMKKRKRILTVSCKEFDILAKKDSENYTEKIEKTENKFTFCSTMKAENLYFVLLNYKNQRTVIYFEPDERMLAEIKRIIPKKVFI